MSKSESYYYIDPESKRTVGPISLSVLQKIRESGIVTDDTEVLGEEDGEWKQFKEIPQTVRNVETPSPTVEDTVSPKENSDVSTPERDSVETHPTENNSSPSRTTDSGPIVSRKTEILPESGKNSSPTSTTSSLESGLGSSSNRGTIRKVLTVVLVLFGLLGVVFVVLLIITPTPSGNQTSVQGQCLTEKEVIYVLKNRQPQKGYDRFSVQFLGDHPDLHCLYTIGWSSSSDLPNYSDTKFFFRKDYPDLTIQPSDTNFETSDTEYMVEHSSSKRDNTLEVVGTYEGDSPEKTEPDAGSSWTIPAAHWKIVLNNGGKGIVYRTSSDTSALDSISYEIEKLDGSTEVTMTKNGSYSSRVLVGAMRVIGRDVSIKDEYSVPGFKLVKVK